MANVVFARKTTVVGNVTVRHGDAWAADSEMVAARPDLFVDEPTRIATGGPKGAREIRTGDGTIETATRRPGEKRKTPRKRASTRPPETENDD